MSNLSHFHNRSHSCSIFMRIHSVIVIIFWKTYRNIILHSSFGCDEMAMPGFNPSFRIQGQLYHHISSMVPSTGDTPRSSQIYSLIQESQMATRCQIVGGLTADIVSTINQLLHNANQLFMKWLIWPTGNVRIGINETKRPTGEHSGRYNSPLSNEIGVLMPNENVNTGT